MAIASELDRFGTAEKRKKISRSTDPGFPFVLAICNEYTPNCLRSNPFRCESSLPPPCVPKGSSARPNERKTAKSGLFRALHEHRRDWVDDVDLVKAAAPAKAPASPRSVARVK
jgi:hypothetical protein